MRKQATDDPPRRGRRPAARSATVQYTVRDVPAHVDRALRRKAGDEGKSLSQVLRETLAKETTGAANASLLHHDLDHLAGTWDEDPEFDRAIGEQDRVDKALWR